MEDNNNRVLTNFEEHKYFFNFSVYKNTIIVTQYEKDMSKRVQEAYNNERVLSSDFYIHGIKDEAQENDFKRKRDIYETEENDFKRKRDIYETEENDGTRVTDTSMFTFLDTKFIQKRNRSSFEAHCEEEEEEDDRYDEPNNNSSNDYDYVEPMAPTRNKTYIFPPIEEIDTNQRYFNVNDQYNSPQVSKADFIPLQITPQRYRETNVPNAPYKNRRPSKIITTRDVIPVRLFKKE
jgi:hypothetical protein